MDPTRPTRPTPTAPVASEDAPGVAQAVTIDHASYHGWDATWIHRGPLSVVLVPQIGGRVMGLRWRGHELSFVHPGLAGRVESLDRERDVRQQKRALGFLLWGGEKTWLAPQEAWNDELPFLDLDSGRYSLEVSQAGADEDATVTACMRSPVCRETGVRITRVVRVSAARPGWEVDHIVENTSEHTQRWAAWTVAMVRRPAEVYFLTSPDSAHPQGVKTFIDHPDADALRARVVTHQDDLVHITCGHAEEFKYGTDSRHGAVLAIWPQSPVGQLGLLRQVPYVASASYAHGCVVEVFNAPELPYCELELHSPCTTLAPGAQVTLRERSHLFELKDAPSPRQILVDGGPPA